MKMVEGDNQIEYKLEDVLTDKDVDCIINKSLKNGLDWQVVHYVVKPVVNESTGFVGEYFKVKLQVEADGDSVTLKLFVKRVPRTNQPKADFINDNHFYKREALVYQLIEELTAIEGPLIWCTKALVHNENLLVMADLRSLGYSPRPQTETLDLAHALVTVASAARFHAAIANYETRKSSQHLAPWTISQEYSNILGEPTFKDTLWMRCAVKLTANLLKTFSNQHNNIDNLESKLQKLFLQACDDMKEYENTLNVLIHKDLWINNIMFRYEDGVPVNALLIDYQCIRYGPPSFDLMIFLYCSTSRSFREQYEKKVFHQYFSVFVDNLEEATKQRLVELKYDEKEFLRWCERSRMFGALIAIGIFPYILMDPTAAKKTYDDPETYDEYLVVDRTKPVVAHCRQNAVYRQRQLELCEEFVERYAGK
ncbi:uncharacterized protein LOC128674773 [Plodia interpunctella]|uniref:uncharacterized protein LOC128674773 n=1 Tax=Plodia interpunctella TaxID=58824 RepID=UPI002367722B|nr:uncharacterized protein LOC128674773 [Plodia interpunctella]